jgi:hypothetical protein
LLKKTEQVMKFQDDCVVGKNGMHINVLDALKRQPSQFNNSDPLFDRYADMDFSDAQPVSDILFLRAQVSLSCEAMFDGCPD